MYSWLITKLVALIYRKVSRGELSLPLLGMAKDACLIFPGSNSFSGEHRGKPAIEAWMKRFASLHPEFTVHGAAAAGTPWNLRVYMRFTDRIVAPDGFVYENHGVEYLSVRFGLVREIRVYLDTEKVTALDAHLGPAT